MIILLSCYGGSAHIRDITNHPQRDQLFPMDYKEPIDLGKGSYGWHSGRKLFEEISVYVGF